MRSPAEINDAAREAFVHRDISFAGEWIFWMKTGPVTADAAFVAERSGKGLPQHDAAIFDGVVCVHLEITLATEFQIHDRVFGEQREHVVEKGYAGFDRGFAMAVKVEIDSNAGFFGVPRDLCLPRFHGGH